MQDTKPTTNATTTRDAWASSIKASWSTAVASILETGRALAAAKAALPHGEFAAMIETDLPFGARTAQRLMQIAANPVLSDATHVSLLPASWSTLAELARVDADTLEAAIDSGDISPEMTRADAKRIAAPKYTLHPVAEIFPPMHGEEWTGFRESIRRVGVLVPILVTRDGQIIDGKERYRAARELGIECPARVWGGDEDVETLCSLVWSLNAIRTSLNEGQRTVAFVKYKRAQAIEAAR